ncbi:hypothetical protein ACFYWP_01485 [Actinacidiphila glaucinigra]|uniref:hypothetical protein n=1 Tax=Actinacidiphila glaucinigra TaxID=235986 RepID=UPI0036C23718
MDSLTEIITRYREAYDKREAGIGAFLDDEGNLKKGARPTDYDEHCYDAWSDSHGDLGSLLAELESATGFGLEVGARVRVKADAATAHGGEVQFGGEVIGTVINEVDRDGDVEVRAYDGLVQFVAARFVERIND